MVEMIQDSKRLTNHLHN